jgi:hypothetical protein
LTFAKCSSRFNGKTKMPFLPARDVRPVEYIDRSIAIGVMWGCPPVGFMWGEMVGYTS